MAIQQVRGSTRKRALPILVAGIATERGYRIRYTSDLGFAIDQKNKVIFVPSLRAIGSDEDAEVLEGGIDHELGHDHETDPTYDGRAVFQNPLMHCMWNAIEDPRMELGFFVKFPGARRHIARTLEIMTSRGCFRAPLPTDHPSAVLMGYLRDRLRFEVLGQTYCQDFIGEIRRAAETMFGPIAQQAYDIAAEVVRNERGRQGTWKTVEATRKIFDLLKAAMQPAQPETQPQQGSASGQQGLGESAGSSPGNSSDQGDSSDQDEDVKGSGQGKPDDSADQGGKKRSAKAGAKSSKSTGKEDAAESAEAEGSAGGQDDNNGQDNAQADNAGGGSAEPSDAGDPGDASGGTGETGEGSGSDGSNDGEKGSSGGVRSSQPSAQGAGGGAGGPGPLTEDQQQTAADALAGSVSDAGDAGKGLEDLISGAAGVGAVPGAHASCEVNAEESRAAGTGPINLELLVTNQEAARRISLDLAVKLEDLLLSYDRVDTRHRRSGRFDSTRCVNARLGDLRVYERSQLTESLNTAVVLLIDDSGSMYPERAPLAQAAFFGIGNILDRCDVPFAGASFGSGVHLLHAFGDSWRKTVGTAHFSDHGGTWMEAAYYFAIEQLSTRREDRHIVLIVTDGEPGSWEATEAMIQEAQRLGVETRCVLLSPTDDACQRFIGARTRPGVARIPGEIPQAVFKTLEDALIEA
jgi:hypothetical protein